MQRTSHAVAVAVVVIMGNGNTGYCAGHVAINQAGYKPSFNKYALVTSSAESIAVVDAASNQVRFSARLSPWQSNDPSTGQAILRGDFSSFSMPGEYRIVTSTGEQSEVFSISDTVYNTTYRRALKALYYQRCGSTLAPDIAGAYWHPQCHALDGLLHSSTDSSGYRRTLGGWHDAGDYGKYVVNAGVTLGTLMMAYEYFPSHFSHDNLNIPESGNGVPDILDEIRYELSWLNSMARADGAVYFKLTRTQFEGFVMPQQDGGSRYIYQVSSTATADFAAVMARAARIYQAFDTTFAAECKSAALRAWTFLAANPALMPPNGFRNPPGTATGEYGDTDDTDERLWAAAELFVTTGGSVYNNNFIFNYPAGGIFTSAMSWQNVRSLAHLTYLRSTQQGTDQGVLTQLRQSLVAYCQAQVTRRNSSGYHVVLRPGEYLWGSNSSALNTAVLLILGYQESNDVSFLQTAVDQLHYVLGTNAHGLSFVTGVGSRRPMQPHHRPSGSDGIAEPVPGLLVGGPDQYRSDPVLQALFTSTTPPALCYVDSLPSYASNEIAINWNAPLVFVAGYCNGIVPTGVQDATTGDAPSLFNLRQNYPNPFNGITRVSFFLPAADDIQLLITDITGRRVLTQYLGRRSAGEHAFAWPALRQSGIALSSGVYFMMLSGNRAFSNVRKLILLN